MSVTPETFVPLPLPRPVILGGRRLIVCLPEPAPGQVVPVDAQPPLPLGGTDECEDAGPDLEPARRWVGMLGRVVVEVLTGRRPAAQLAGRLDDRSVAYLAAWANKGTLRPRSVGTPHLRAVTRSRIEGWMSFRTADHEFVAVLCLHHDGSQWSCRDLRVIAPAGGVAA